MIVGNRSFLKVPGTRETAFDCESDEETAHHLEALKCVSMCAANLKELRCHEVAAYSAKTEDALERSIRAHAAALVSWVIADLPDCALSATHADLSGQRPPKWDGTAITLAAV